MKLSHRQFSGIFFYIVITILCPEADFQRIQEFTIYSTTEVMENYTQSVRDLDLVSSIVRDKKLQSVCSQLGVWAFFTGKNFTTSNSYGYHPAIPGWTCQNRRIMGDYLSPFRSIRHLGNSDLEISSLSLYTDPFFASDELYFNGQEMSWFGSPFHFASFGFTGRDNWTLYSEPNFSGETVCLLCKCDDTGVAVGVTYTAKLTISVSSIRKGCFGTQILLPNGILENRTQNGVNSKPSSEPNTNTNNLISLSLTDSTKNTSLMISGSELRLPCIKNFDIFSISKRSIWTVYTGSEFDGIVTCLLFPPGQFSRGRVTTTNSESDIVIMKKTMSVGSIKFGCPQNLAKENSTIILVAPIKSGDSRLPNSKLMSTSTQLPNIIKPEQIEKVVVSSTQAQPSREGRGRHINLMTSTTSGYFSGNLKDELVTKVTTKPPGTSTTSTIITITTSATTQIDLSTTPMEDLVVTGIIHDNLVHLTSTESTINQLDHNSIKEPSSINHSIPITYDLENEKSSKKISENTNDLDNRHTPKKEAATIEQNENSGTVGMFFTAFLIILGILVTAMIVTIIVFIYLRATRTAQADMEA